MGFASDLPPRAGAARDRVILRAVAEGRARWEWMPVVTHDERGREAEFLVFGDALRIDGIRVNGSASLQQRIADLLGVVMLTPRLVDENWTQAPTKVDPQVIRPVSSSTAAMLEHSELVDAEAGGAEWIADPGKDWALWASAPQQVVTYGWHATRAWSDAAGVPVQPDATRGALVVQPPWAGHGLQHVDYSQTLRFAASTCRVDGESMPTARVYTSTDLAGLATHDGKPLRSARVGGVPTGHRSRAGMILGIGAGLFGAAVGIGAAVRNRRAA